MIEVRGASQAYAGSCAAIKYQTRLDGVKVSIGHYVCFWAANSEDEAYGKAMKEFLQEFPISEGWIAHDITLERIDKIEWIESNRIA